jgi:23S rRNA (cytosine1962-C5)-methyltransferase
VTPGERVAVRVTADAARRVRAGHPWVFDGSITSGPAPDDVPAGTLAVVFDPSRRFAGIGLWDPASPMRVKMLHHGAPRAIDASWWDERIGAAFERRATLARSGDTDSYRCIHGESDGFPSLVLDRYADTYVLELFGDLWWPHLDDVMGALAERLDHDDRVVLRTARGARPDLHGSAEGAVLLGTAPDGPVRCRELGLLYDVDVVSGQKTGRFLDQRENRRFVRSLARERRVLDVFCADGGFTLAAAAGGASSVHSVDASAPAIAATVAHLELNIDQGTVPPCRHRSTVGDAFEVMARLKAAGERYDLVVVDPPAFARRREQVEGAIRAYRRLAALAVDLTAPGGYYVQASCTARVRADDIVDAMRRAAGRSGRPFIVESILGHAADHPIGFPEAAYLDAVVARIPG